MNTSDLFDFLPLLGVFLASFINIYIAIEIGHYLGKRRLERLPKGEKIEIGPMATACLSLLAFMLAIVFGSVNSRYNELKHVVLDESNAIGTAFLRADLLPTEDRLEVRNLLREYTTWALKAMQSGDTDEMHLASAKSEELQADLWAIAVSYAEEYPTPVSSLFVQSLNEMIDMHEKRITVGLHHRLPGDVWIMLFGLAFLAMAVGGYHAGLNSNRRLRTAYFLAAVAYSVVFAYVVALDRYHQRESMQAPMIDVRDDIRGAIQK